MQALLAVALKGLDENLHRQHGNRVVMLHELDEPAGSVAAVLRLARSLGALSVHMNRREEPFERWREEELLKVAPEHGLRVERHSAFLFKDPEHCPIFEAIGHGQHIFKAFWEGWHKGPQVRRVVSAPKSCPPTPQLRAALPFGGSASADWPFGGQVPISRVTGRPLREDAEALAGRWDLTEAGALSALAEFQESEAGLSRYRGSVTRDAGPRAKESRLSPYFRLGLLSMVDAWWRTDRGTDQGKKWLRRCTWRDYSYWMLRNWPQLPEVPMRLAYDSLEWSYGCDDPAFAAWREGRTGFPLIDASMRELKATGYLQQNVRHTVGQFLVETLGVDWRDGEEWFHCALGDSDLAINSMMWQHQGLAGVSQWLVGIDCHPVRHAKDVDPGGDYVRKWVPELARLPKQFLHEPWCAPRSVLEGAGLEISDRRRTGCYPPPIVDDVDRARAEFLARAKRARACAPPSCFSRDGCDLMSMPSSSGLSGGGIRALTERCFRDGGSTSDGNDASRERGKGHGGKGKDRGKGKSKVNSWSSTSDQQPPVAGAEVQVPTRRWGSQTARSSEAQVSDRRPRWRAICTEVA